MLLFDFFELFIVAFENFHNQFMQFLACFGEHSSSRRSGPIVFTPSTSDDFRSRCHEACLYQSVQNRIQCPRAQAIAMSFEFVGDFRTVDWLFRRMVQDMQANEAAIHIPGKSIGSHIEYQYRISIV